ncbi:hypothetical protein MYX75_08225 [Acidobacteria bacterium AH-259-A15]|nr:hypothetical protein [Acidobacteria bacterium AH-259-A15]
MAWFGSLLTNQQWQDSLIYSVVVALLVSALGTLITTVYSYYVRLSPAWLEIVTFCVISIVLLSPPIAYGLSLRFVGAVLDFPEWLVLGIGHLVLILPIQYLVFEASREFIDPWMIAAARTLGASNFRSLISVFVPTMWLPIVTATILGFFVSFDEVVVAVSVLERALITTPLRLWKGLSHQVTPDPAVISVLLTIGLLLALGLRNLVQRWIDRPRRRRL